MIESQVPPDAAARDEAFPIVGVGASAGGLQAYQQFLADLPDDTGMGFVLVQHLDRSHESRLVDLLGRSTSMPIVAATDDLGVLPNHVYVIPPNATLRLEGGRLRLTPRAEGAVMPVDAFLTSLAADRGNLGIGVILSGSGADGAEGIREIKNAGGIAFAQTEASALHTGMPGSAIATGCVDFVLPPAEIGRELARLSAHPYLRPTSDASAPPAQVAGQFQRVLDLVRISLGLDFRQYRDTTVRRRILRRVALLRLPGLADYVTYLEKNRGEIEALYEDLLINVTSFFRDPDTFDGLRDLVFPEIVKDHPAGTPIRIWVPACSTGQEAYSLAISLVEFLDARGLHLPIQVFATDVSDAVSLAKARAGLYSAAIESEVSPERLHRFFVKEDGGYRVTKSIRGLCVFAKQNVATDPPFSRIGLISCRNLFIYLAPPIQRRVISTFHFALNANGFLMLGRAETAGTTDLFRVVDQSRRIYAKQGGALRRHPFDVVTSGLAWPAPTPPPAVLPPTSAEWRREADRTVLGQYAPAGVLVSPTFEILQFRGRTNRFLEPAAGEASLDLMRMAHEGLLPALRRGFEECRRTHAPVTVPGVTVKGDGDADVIDLRILPVRLPSSPDDCYLVLFDDATSAAQAGRATDQDPAQPTAGHASRRGSWWTRLSGQAGPPAKPAQDETVARLTQELTATKDYLQSIIEQRDATYEELRSANEEVLSSNEELQSTNEELETAKEEMQSLNEELTTVNEQLLARNLELVHTNDDLTNVLGSPALPILIVGPDLCIRRMTTAATPVFDIRAKDVGRSMDDLPTLVAMAIREPTSAVIGMRSPVTLETLGANGRWYQLGIHPYRTTEDRVDGAVIVAIDIDDAKRAEIRVGETRDLVRAVVDTTRTALIVLDGELRVLMANPAFYETFGGRPDGILGRPFEQVGDGRWDIGGVRQRLDDVLRTGHSLEGAEITLDHAAEPRTVVLNVRRLVQIDGEAARLLVALEDVTSRRKAEHELRVSESRYRLLFENSLEGILLVDVRTQRVRDANRFFCAMLDTRREDVIDRELWQLGLAKDVDASRAVVAEVQQQGYARYEHLPLRRHDGRTIEVEFLSSLCDLGGERVIQSVVREVSERKGLEADLRRLAHDLAEADRRKTQFLATLAHELRNPLAPIVTGLHILRSAASAADKKEWAIDVMGRQIQQMVRLIEDLLDLSRITRGTIELRIEPVDLAGVVGAALEAVRPMVQAADQTLHVEMPPEVVTVDADPTRLSQMFTNLLSNASKYTGPSGEIWLHAERQDRELFVSVRDTGIGIARDVQPHIFDMFFQADPPIARSPGGLGVGLTLVRTIVELHGGTIAVSSAGLGSGTEFRVRLPLSQGAGRAATAHKAELPTRSHAPGRQRILVVDDDADSAESLATGLRLRGQDVRVATDGDRALEVADLWQPHAILLDLGLPGMSGYSVASKLRAQPAFAGTIIVAVTAHGHEDDRKRSRESGIDHHVVKPYDLDEVFGLLRPS